MKKGVSKSIAFILMMSLLPGVNVLADAGEKINIDISSLINDDLFIKTGRVVASYYDEAETLRYYDGDQYADAVTIDSVQYKLYGDMASRKDDVIKIDTSDVTIPLEQGATRTVGIMMFSRETEKKTINVKLNYSGGKTDNYIVDVNNMYFDNETEKKNPIKIVKDKTRYNSVVAEGEDVFLQASTIDNTKSVNKNLDLESITIPAADFEYYVAAVTQIKFSEAEIEEQTRENVRRNYSKYKDMNFLQVAAGEDDTSLDELKELHSSMLRQQGKMPEATEENIAAIYKLSESTELYIEIDGLKTGFEKIAGEYKDYSADFKYLSETDLTAEDYKKITEAVSFLKDYDSADLDKMNEAISYYRLDGSVDISLSGDEREHICELYDAYTTAKSREELKAEIELYYDDYINKEISEIEKSDLEKLEKLISSFEKAEDTGIVFEEYNDRYIRHLYNDYEAYQKSEEFVHTDMSELYNVELYAIVDEEVNAETWYECNDNLNGDMFLTAKHRNMVGYDTDTGIMSVKEYEYVREETYNEATEITTVKYPFTATGGVIKFYMPARVFKSNVEDALLVKKSSSDEYTVKFDRVYADKIYFAVPYFGNKTMFEPVINYADETKQAASIQMNHSGQVCHEILNLKDKVYGNVVCYVGASNYKDMVRAKTGVLYYPEGNTTNGMLIVELPVDNTKLVDSVTFLSASVDYTVSAVSLKPCENSMLSERTAELYNAVVSDGEVVSKNPEEISDLVLNYQETRKRGLYIEEIDENIIESLSQKVLTASGEAYRYDKDSVKAEISFSKPITPSSLESSITVKNESGDTLGYDVKVSEDNMSAVVDIAVSKEAEGKINIYIDKTVTLQADASVSMVYPVSVIYDVPEYLSGAYSENMSVSLKNNSRVSQEYIVFATVNNDGRIITQTTKGTISAGGTKTEVVDTSMYYGSDIQVAVVDSDTYAPLCEMTEIKSSEEQTVLTADYTAPTLDFKTNKLKINGFTSSKLEGKIVSLFVNSPEGNTFFAGEVKTNSDGYFSFEVPVTETDVPVSGNLEVILSGEDFSSAYKNSEVYFPVEGDRVNIVSRLKNAADDKSVMGMLETAQKDLSLNFAPYVYCVENESAAEKIALRIFNNQKNIPEISETDSEEEISKKLAEVQNLIKNLSVLVCINEKNTDAVSNGTELLYDDVLGYSSIDAEGVTLYNIYQTGIAEEGKKEILKAISGENFADKDEYFGKLKELFMLYALKNPANKGVGHVSAIFTEENADAVEIDIDKYLALKDKSAADSYIANMNVNSLEDVLEYIATLGGNTSTSTNKGSGSSGGTGGGSTGMVPTFPVANQQQIKEENDKNTAKADGFADVPESHWAYSAITKLVKAGIINGRSENTFAPEENISRAEFVKLLCVAKGLDISGEVSDKFTDVTVNDWYAPYVTAAFNTGIINGVSENEFGANSPITRQDICTVLYRMTENGETVQSDFADYGEISDYAKEAVSYLNSIGVINGYEDNTFRPSKCATRAQAARILCNYLELVK